MGVKDATLFEHATLFANAFYNKDNHTFIFMPTRGLLEVVRKQEVRDLLGMWLQF